MREIRVKLWNDAEEIERLSFEVDQSLRSALWWTRGFLEGCRVNPEAQEALDKVLEFLDLNHAAGEARFKS